MLTAKPHTWSSLFLHLFSKQHKHVQQQACVWLTCKLLHLCCWGLFLKIFETCDQFLSLWMYVVFSCLLLQLLLLMITSTETSFLVIFWEQLHTRCFFHEVWKLSWILKLCCSGRVDFFISKSSLNLIPGGFKRVWEHLNCGSLIPAVITFIPFLLGSLQEGWISALQPGEALNEWPLRQSEVPQLQQMLNGERWPLGPDAGGCSGCLWITLIPWNNGAPPRSLLRGINK